MIVCVCHRISDREIARFARAGMGFDEIQLELGVATQCGNCEGCARELVSQCHASAPLAHSLRCGPEALPAILIALGFEKAGDGFRAREPRAGRRRGQG